MTAEELKMMTDNEINQIVDRFLNCLGYTNPINEEDRINNLKEVIKRLQLDSEYVIYCMLTEQQNEEVIKSLESRIQSNDLLIEEINQYIGRLPINKQISEENKIRLWPFSL